ncbi:MAG: DUF192 domain-containing protein [Treponema sp.]|jgi:uncharacterized membrane protein (UPF0127 family)|nr:DUF192 domain-containing protein [Treponema sp.]
MNSKIKIDMRCKESKNFTTEFHGERRRKLYNLVISLLIVSTFCFNILSCQSQKLTVREIIIERDGQTIVVVKAEIAVTQEERNKGLMYRKTLPDGEGMFFVFDRDEVLSFWMKNTSIPLSIAFIAYDGRIVEIKNMYPQDTNSVQSGRSVRYALEAPQGWFSRAGVAIGDVVNLDFIN